MEKKNIQQYLVELNNGEDASLCLVLLFGAVSIFLTALLLISLALSFHLEYSLTLILASVFTLGMIIYRSVQFSKRWQSFQSIEQMVALVEKRLPSFAWANIFTSR